MIIATLLALSYLMFGGAGFDTLFGDLDGDRIEMAVADSDRAERIEGLSKDLADALGDNKKLWDEQLKELVEVQDGYRSFRADFDAKLQHLENTLAERHDRVFKTRSAMKELMNESEWNILFAED